MRARQGAIKSRDAKRGFNTHRTRRDSRRQRERETGRESERERERDIDRESEI